MKDRGGVKDKPRPCPAIYVPQEEVLTAEYYQKTLHAKFCKVMRTH